MAFGRRAAVHVDWRAPQLCALSVSSRLRRCNFHSTTTPCAIPVSPAIDHTISSSARIRPRPYWHSIPSAAVDDARQERLLTSEIRCPPRGLVGGPRRQRAAAPGPVDAAPCTDAAFDALDLDRVTAFIGAARRARQFPLAEDAPPEALLEHLNLLDRGRPTNAAVLLFGKRPQRFLLSSVVKCAHFHGTRVGRPIPSHQVYQGTVFEPVDHAVDFVLGKIALSVGTRAESVETPVAYEIPKEVVTEAIVNAVAHRDYTSNASVQVMLFADRLEIWNPARCPRR